MNGSWGCRYSTASEKYKYTYYDRSLNSVDAKTLSYLSITIAEVKVNDDSVFKLNIKTKGNFTVEGDISTSVITDADINVVSGSLTDKFVDEVKQNLLNQIITLKTLKIDDKEWIVEDLEDGTETTCKKI